MSPPSAHRGRLLLALAAIAYGVSPVDLVPDGVPVLGLVDDLGVAGIALLLALAWARRPATDPRAPDGAGAPRGWRDGRGSGRIVP